MCAMHQALNESILMNNAGAVNHFKMYINPDTVKQHSISQNIIYFIHGLHGLSIKSNLVFVWRAESHEI